MSTTLMPEESIIQFYEKSILELQDYISRLRETRRLFAIARLATICIGAVICFYLRDSAGFLLCTLLSTLAIFIFLVFRDSDNKTAIEEKERMVAINIHELDIKRFKLDSYDDGIQFADPHHAYASDLDLFGPYSLFQFLNRCHAEQSKKLLAENLKSPFDPERIRLRQEAIDELSKKQKWTQQFQSRAMSEPLTAETEKKMKQWIQHTDDFGTKQFWKILPLVYSLIAISILITFILDYITPGVFSVCIVLFFGISSLISARIQSTYDLLSQIYPEMDALYMQIEWIENEKFNAPYLITLLHRLKQDNQHSASKAMFSFRGILKRFDIRLNLLVFVFLNAFLLWDLRQLNALNLWKKFYRTRINEWVEVISQIEVLISFASLRFNEPAWVFPKIDDRFFHFAGESIGHPLINSTERITNDFRLDGTGRVVLITGSNMAGKSTFLRSLGTNVILALTGAPVCASTMNLSRVNLISSMRVADNLAENTSTFYAELKKLKQIIEAVNRRDRVLILLDEVLRGTNSTDRHKGTRALVHQLLNQQAVAVVATHDTELAFIESKSNASVLNYHFDAEIRNDELYFDYKIKTGISESLNATTLMKKIGIEFKD